jgi:EAL domain-containing protein (putative c-di-GMP-specific phosphodiesterase class I)
MPMTAQITRPDFSAALPRGKTSATGEAVPDPIASAIRDGRFMLAFQPVMSARDQSRVAFQEGLARLVDDHGRIIPAGAFMEQIEGTALGRELDRLALEHGLRALRDTPGLRLSINMSARTIGHQPWLRTLDRWLDADETIGERLIVEITESSAIQCPETVRSFMTRLRARGISFAIDDFGAGHTSFRYFSDYCFDMVKIDGRFIRGIAASEDKRAVTSALIGIARRFDMLVVAEFVETAEDAAALVGLGVDCLQGYHFSEPRMSPDWAGDWLPGVAV